MHTLTYTIEPIQSIYLNINYEYILCQETIRKITIVSELYDRYAHQALINMLTVARNNPQLIWKFKVDSTEGCTSIELLDSMQLSNYEEYIRLVRGKLKETVRINKKIKCEMYENGRLRERIEQWE